MDFCCDDDFTESNSFLTDDVDIYLAYQAYLVGSGGEHPQLNEFKDYYSNLVSSGIAQELVNEIKKLPASECADYTETGSISTDDSNIYSAFQAYLISTGGIKPSEVHTFDEYFQNSLVNTGLVNPLNSPIKHLPSLANDDYVISSTGNVDKNCPTPTPTLNGCVTTPVTIIVSSEYDSSSNTRTYKYTTSDSSGNGELFGCINVNRGDTLTILVTGNPDELEIHPLTITNFNDQGQAMESVNGIVKTDLTEGPNEDNTYSLTWLVPCDETIDKYQYQCEEYAHMRGTINVFGSCTTSSDCLPNISTGNNKSYPTDAPVTHVGGGTFDWCGGTQYTDPGLLPIKDLCDETHLTIENGGVEVLYFDSTGEQPITNLTEIEKLGLLLPIELDTGATMGPSSYTFKIKYKLSYNNQTKIGGGRSINVKNCSTPTPTPTPTFFEEEPDNEYIYDSMEAVSIKGGTGESSSVKGYNNRSLDLVQGVNGVSGLNLENNIVTLTEPGRYYIKARSGSYMSEWTSTAIYFISGDYETQRFESQRRWCHANNSSDVVVTESSVVVDITQLTTFKIQTYINKAKSGNGLSYGGGASLFVQKLANVESDNSSSVGGGGIGSLDIIKSKNSFYTELPDAIIADNTDQDGGTRILYLTHYGDGMNISYHSNDATKNWYIYFDKDDANGASIGGSNISTTEPFNNLRGYIENDRAIYYGGSSSSGVEIGNVDVFKGKSNFNGTLPSVIYTTSYGDFTLAFILTDVNPDKIYYRYPYEDWWLEFANDPSGTITNHNGVEHQSVNGTKLVSLQAYIDNGYATFLGSGGTSSSSSSSGSAIMRSSYDDTANITYELGVQSYNVPQNTSLNVVDCCFHDGKLSISVDYEISNSTDLHIHVKPSEHRIAKKFNNIRTGSRTINYVFNIDFNPTQVLVFLSDSGWLERSSFKIINTIPTCDSLVVEPTPTPELLKLNTIRIKECCVIDNELSILIEYNIDESVNLQIHLKPANFRIGKTFANLEVGYKTKMYTFKNINFDVTQVVAFLTKQGWVERIDADVLNNIPTCITPINTPTPTEIIRGIGDDPTPTPTPISKNTDISFASLIDTPSELSAGKYIKVNDTGDGIEFVDVPSGDPLGGGDDGGGISSNSYVQSKSNFDKNIPDVIIAENSSGGLIYYEFGVITDTMIFFIQTGNDKNEIVFDNNPTGTLNTKDVPTHTVSSSLSEIITNNRVIYYGGGGGSTTSGGIHSNINVSTEFKGDYILPDAIMLPMTRSNSDHARVFHFVGFYGGTDGGNHTSLQYEWIIGSNERFYIQFANDADGTFSQANNSGSTTTNFNRLTEIASQTSGQPSLKEIIADNRAIYYGGSSSSNGNSFTNIKQNYPSVLKQNQGDFYTDLPYAIIAKAVVDENDTRYYVHHLQGVRPNMEGWQVLYRCEDFGDSSPSTDLHLQFKLDEDGTFLKHASPTHQTHSDNTQNLRWFIENDKAIYFGVSGSIVNNFDHETSVSFVVYPRVDTSNKTKITIKSKNGYLKSVDENNSSIDVKKFDIINTTEASTLTSTQISNVNQFIVVGDTLYYITDDDPSSHVCTVESATTQEIYTDYNFSTPNVKNLGDENLEITYSEGGDKTTPILLEHLNGIISFSVTASATPTPTPHSNDCCDGLTESLVFQSDGSTEDGNKISATSSIAGKLCHNTFTGDTLPTSYLCPFEVSDFSKGGLSIEILAPITSDNRRLTFESVDGSCYEGELTSITNVNVFVKVS
tara:strand:- start:400 stop:5628 length:5229 start_codon:yes stop_codon:yes gene_type:complete